MTGTVANIEPKPAVTDGPYGPWVIVVADDGRRLGVSVTPYRVRTHLIIHDVDQAPRTYVSESLPPTPNPWVHAVAELWSNHPDYHWDTPAYRELCEQGGLDPDYRRPVFHPEYAEAGAALMIELNKINAGSPTATNVMMDVLDLMRSDPWVSSRKDIDVIRHEVRMSVEYDPTLLDELRALLSRIPNLSRLRLI